MEIKFIFIKKRKKLLFSTENDCVHCQYTKRVNKSTDFNCPTATCFVGKNLLPSPNNPITRNKNTGAWEYPRPFDNKQPWVITRSSKAIFSFTFTHFWTKFQTDQLRGVSVTFTDYRYWCNIEILLWKIWEVKDIVS